MNLFFIKFFQMKINKIIMKFYFSEIKIAKKALLKIEKKLNSLIQFM